MAVLLTLSLVGNATAAGASFHRGENLLQPVPPPDLGWEVRQGVVEGDPVVEWRMPDDTQYLMARVRKTSGGSIPSRFRETFDNEGRKHCAEYDSTLVSDDPVNGFARSLWRVRCVRNDQSIDTFLHLYIGGRDSAYYLTHKWSGDPGEQSIHRWVTYLDSVNVCDTRRRRNAPCP